MAWILAILVVLPTPVGAANDVTLNLKNADIRTLIETVAEATGRNFVIDPRVKAKVTVVSPKAMNKKELYQVFLSILQVHGYSAVQVGEVTKIVPDVTAKQGPVPVGPGKGDQLVTEVIPIEYVPAAQLVPILRPLVPQQGHLAAYAASNSLVISDRADNVKRLRQIIERVDEPESQDIEVIRLQHAAASEIVRIVSSLREQQGNQGNQQLPGRPILAADDRTNSVLLSGDKAGRLRLRALIAHLDTPLQTSGGTHVVFLHYAQAEELAPILLGVGEEQNQQGGQGAGAPGAGGAAPTATPSSTPTTGGENGEIQIQADERNNALIITAPPDEFERIKTVIRQLDIRRAQVLVEAIIAEVSTNLARDLGIQFAVAPSGDNPNGPAALSTLGSNSSNGVPLTSILGNPVQAIGNAGANFLLGAADLGGSTNFAVLLQALASDTATNILSTPTLVTLDNEEAEVVVAQNVPFVTGNFTTPVSGGGGVVGGGATGGAVSPFQTIERRDVGITLRLTPQINEGNSVQLAIEQESSSLAPSVQAASDLITNTRNISTSVLVEDGKILVLGGLFQDTFNDNQQKVPLLGDIPLIGRLFRSDSTSKEKMSLMVFIRPVILRDQATASAYTNSKYDYLRARQLEANIQGRGLIRDTSAQFPSLDDLITQLPESLQGNDKLMNMKPDLQSLPQ